MVYTAVWGRDQARQLAEDIVSDRRNRTYVVVTPSPDGTYPFDAEEIADGVGAFVKVFRLEKPALTFELSKKLGKELSAFHGAARVYPVGTAWMDDIHAAPLYLPSTDVSARQTTLVERALQAAYASTPIDDERSAADDLRAENAQLRAVIERLERELSAAPAKAGEVLVKKEIRVEEVAPPLYRPLLFVDHEQALRYAILAAWVLAVPADAKPLHPLPESYLVGPHFIESIEVIDEGKRERALRATADVLSGMGTKSRDIHVLTAGPAAGPTTRIDGAVCFRAYVERKSPSARRIHFWKHRDGTIELSRVVLHDDFAP